MGNISWAAKKAGEAASKGGRAVEGVSESIKFQCHQNWNKLLWLLAFLILCKLPFLVSGALAVILEVLNLPPISIHSIVGLLTGFLTYLEITDTDKDNDRTRKML